MVNCIWAFFSIGSPDLNNFKENSTSKSIISGGGLILETSILYLAAKKQGEQSSLEQADDILGYLTGFHQTLPWTDFWWHNQ